MRHRRKHAFATVVTLAAALAAGSALAMAESNQSMFGASVSAQSTTTQDEASPPQAAYPSQSQAGTSVDEPNGFSSDEAAGSDDSDNSAMESNDSDNSALESGDYDNSAEANADSANADSDMAAQANTARAYGPSASSTATVEDTPPDEAASVAAPAPVYGSVPAYIAPPNSPLYTPETGDAEYGSKLNPAGPQSDRFNDATGQ